MKKLTLDDPRLTAYALGELDGIDQVELKAAVHADPELQNYVEEIRQLESQLKRKFAAEALPEPITVVTPPRSRFHVTRVLSLAAVFALLLGVTSLMVTEQLQRGAEEALTWTAPESVSEKPVDESLLLEDQIESKASTVLPGASLTTATSAPASPEFASVSPETAPALPTEPSLPIDESLAREKKTSAITWATTETDPSPQTRGYQPRRLTTLESVLEEPLLPIPRLANPANTFFEGENYAAITDNPFKDILAPGDERATFSIDVDTASYANVRRFLTNGQRPPKDAVRIEELINYFHYDYPQPERADQPFAVAMEVNDAPWASDHRLLRIGLKAREVAVDKRPASNLVFLLDVSGSMNSYDKLPLLKKALRGLIHGLEATDRVSMIVYAGSSGCVLEPTPGNQQQAILSALENLQAGGSTNGEAGIQLAYHFAKQHYIEGGVNRILLATDGDFNVGVTDTEALIALAAQRAKEDKVFLTILGFGQGNLQDARMEQIANKANGAYYYIDSEQEAHKVLVQEMSSTLVTVAKDVKIQVEFNPAQVQSYRLIGYENRLLANRDFNDDTKDAGEIGAGHTVTALYEIVPKHANDPGDDPLKYRPAQPVVEPKVTPSADLVTVRLRYKTPEGDVSTKDEFALTDTRKRWAEASGDFRFASAVAAFGMLLRESPYAGKASFEQVTTWAEAAKAPDEYGWRREFIDLCKRAQALGF